MKTKMLLSFELIITKQKNTIYIKNLSVYHLLIPPVLESTHCERQEIDYELI